MSNPSNLYAEKIYSEHPLALWALDEQLDYVSIILESERSLESFWDITNATVSTDIIGGEPFADSITSKIIATVPTPGNTTEVICISPNLENFSNLNKTSLGTVSIGSYFYANNPYLQSISIGYEYTDTTTSTIIQKLETYTTSLFTNWGFVSGTFEIPDENTDFRIVIKIVAIEGGVSPVDYAFYLNGITLGQWSEEFSTASLGVTPSALPSDIAISGTNYAIESKAYGLGESSGYYLTNQKYLNARNVSIPLVYGASGITKLTPTETNTPSIIVPGKGFLNKLGQYKDYTVEFWARINSDTIEPKRIFGPISGLDGLYVETGFLTLVIGNQFSSHFVGEWFRPMLIHVRVIKNSATVLINGEEVISLSINTDSLVLPEPEVLGKSQDWLGFYSYTDVTPIEIDCIAIYPYQVPITVAKRRWVYGQGVISPEGINSAYGGTSAFIDYPFADYTANYNYPDFAQWQQGTFDNLNTTSTAITTPQYELPEIFLGTKDLQALYTDNELIQSGTDKFITFRPNPTWDSDNPYINFPRFNILNDQIHSIYGIFQIDDDDPTDQILFKFYNTLTGNFFSIRKDGPNIDYYLTYNGVEQEFYSISNFPIGQKFAVGIEIEKLVNSFGGNIAAFFGSQNGLKIYVGGDESGFLTFAGKIFSVGFSTSVNAIAIQDHFDSNGIAIMDAEVIAPAEPENARVLLDHVASYTLLPTSSYGQFFLDIGVSGYWEDYLPLSYFAQYVTNDVGNQYYDLDFLQFNLGYPAPSKLKATEVVAESWSYADLLTEYASPTQKTYQQLDNTLFSGWTNYEDMAQQSLRYYEYDTTNASIRSYITFQYIADGANASLNSFPIEESAKSNRIIDIDEHPSWATTKFEVVDNTLIYPTKTVNFNDLAVVYHIEFKIKNTLTKPIALSRLEFASQALNDNSFNPVGTRFGLNMFPYKKSGLYYDYKTKNPFSIYKSSTPYLYLNRKSGIQVRGDFDPGTDRGIAIPINQTSSSNYRISAAQLWMRYEEKDFPITPTELFEIDYRGDTIKFYMVADSQLGNRAKIYAKSASTGNDFNGLAYYWNGTLVRQPTMTISEWGVLGVAFTDSLNFDGYLGRINLTGPILFNNVAYYQANNLQQVQSTFLRPWLKVKTDGFTNFDWQYWTNNFVWEGVLVISASDIYGVSPIDVYKSYIGTNKIIIDDEQGMSFNPEKIRVYTDTTWQTTVKIPV